MANREQEEILRRGPEEWNAWRRKEAPKYIDLRDADLRGVDLVGEYIPNEMEVFGEPTWLYLVGSDLSNTDLTGSDLSRSVMLNVNFRETQLTNVKMIAAAIIATNFTQAIVNGLDLTDAIVANCVFGQLDLRKVRGLEMVRCEGPSTVGIDTIFQSEGKIPGKFLRRCGVPEELIVQIPSLVGSLQPIQFHSCFISYSHKDKEFATRLHAKMQDEGLRVWYAPEEMKGGRKIHEQIFSAIQVHDKLLLILSEESMASEWVATEIRRARKVEREQNRRKLFPIRLVDFEKIREWECFDSEGGKDLAIELREYFIPDFSNWKDHDSFEKAFAQLLKDLKAEAEKG